MRDFIIAGYQSNPAGGLGSFPGTVNLGLYSNWSGLIYGTPTPYVPGNILLAIQNTPDTTPMGISDTNGNGWTPLLTSAGGLNIWSAVANNNIAADSITFTTGSNRSNSHFTVSEFDASLGAYTSTIGSGSGGSTASVTTPSGYTFTLPTLSSFWQMCVFEWVANSFETFRFAVFTGDLNGFAPQTWIEVTDAWFPANTFGVHLRFFMQPLPVVVGNIAVQKVTNPRGLSQVFNFTPSYEAPFTLTDGGSNVSGSLPVTNALIALVQQEDGSFANRGVGSGSGNSSSGAPFVLGTTNGGFVYPTTVGNLLVMVVWAYYTTTNPSALLPLSLTFSNPSYTWPLAKRQDWISTDGTSGGFVAIYYQPNSAVVSGLTSASLTLDTTPGSAFNSAKMEMAFYEFSGVDVAPLDNSVGASNNTGVASIPSAGNITISGTELVLSAFVSPFRAPTIPQGGGYTFGLISSYLTGQTQYILNAGAGALSTAYGGTETYWSLAAVSFRKAPPPVYSVVEGPIAGWSFTTNSDPTNIVVTAGAITTIIFTNSPPAPPANPCFPLDGTGNPVDGVYINDLSLFIVPATALYTDLVPHANLTSYESAVQGRREIVIDFNGSNGLWFRDLGTIFTWPTKVRTVLDLWQPSIIPMDDDVYFRLAFHSLTSSLGMTGYAHAREMNLAHISTADLTLKLEFDAWPTITLTIPNSGGAQRKDKITLPVNKWKLIQVLLTSTVPFKFYASDMELKCKPWGSSEGYVVLKPVVS